MSLFKNDLLIYLASPYSHPEEEVRDQRYHDVKEVNALMLKSGFMCFCPIVSSYHIAKENQFCTSFDFWGPLDLRILRSCDVFCALTIDGWSSDARSRNSRRRARKSSSLADGASFTTTFASRSRS